ncbi:MAG: DUF929 family protein [Thermoplasmataceae archaeon]
MANRKYSKAKKAQAVEKQLNTKKDFFSFFRSNKKLFTVIGSIAIAAILIAVAFELNVFKDNSTNNVSIPNPFPWGTNFAKVSNQNFGNNIHFYWVSWYGCPVGAANSWGLYSSLLNYIPAIKNDFTFHTSDPYDSAPTEPGLIFNGNISSGKYYFNAYYMYNQYHNATGGGVPISPTSLVTQGLREVNATMPSFVSSIIYTIQTQTPSQTSSTGAPISPINSQFHLVTALIITGPNGAYYLQGPYFKLAELTSDPSVASLYINSNPAAYESYVYPPLYVYQHLQSIQFSGISDLSAEINTIVNNVS